LTFLDCTELEARGADAVTKLQEKDKQIEALTKKTRKIRAINSITYRLRTAKESVMIEDINNIVKEYIYTV
jgi:hypothetical protein